MAKKYMYMKRNTIQDFDLIFFSPVDQQQDHNNKLKSSSIRSQISQKLDLYIISLQSEKPFSDFAN